jgi:hypothetical protein
MAFFAQVPTLVYTAVLGPDSASTADLARLAFGALLWIVLVILNRGAAGTSPRLAAPEAGAVSSPRPRLESPEPVRDGRRVATRMGRAAPATLRSGFRAAR